MGGLTVEARIINIILVFISPGVSNRTKSNKILIDSIDFSNQIKSNMEFLVSLINQQVNFIHNQTAPFDFVR